MICPIMSRQYNYNTNDCVEQKCAWYDRESDSCCVKTIAKELEVVSEAAAGQRIIYTREV